MTHSAPFQVIPVLDLMAGQVVRGFRGQRAQYRPIQSRLCPGADPVTVLDALLDVYPFQTVYIADLDALTGSTVQQEVLDTLCSAHPEINWWIDSAVRTMADLGSLGHPAIWPVLGTESAPEPLWLRTPRPFVLSLDQRDGEPMDPAGLLQQPHQWPSHLIAMTLDRVGSGEGPDLARLARIRALAGPDRALFAAGGVRDADDLHALRNSDCQGVLIASALHDGTLDGAALRATCDTRL